MATKQSEANARWKDKNKEYAKYLSDRSRARSFIRKQATLDDIEELTNLLAERKNLLLNPTEEA